MPPIEPDLAALVQTEIAREASRLRSHRREADRHRGVSWAACGPEGFWVRSQEDLVRHARRTLADRSAWRETPSGQFLGAVVEGQRIAGAAHQACERARAAWSRDFNGNPEACAAAAHDLRMQALQLLRKARLAQRALASASPIATPSGGRE